MESAVTRVPCVVMRGGTSKAVFVEPRALPADTDSRDRLLLALMGSPDRRQIDGLGGGDAPTSKIAIVGSSRRDDADVDYTFVQVGCEAATLDYTGNCGNISAAVGPYAIEQGLVAAVEPITVVRIHNTNTGRMIIAEVPVADGQPLVDGSLHIAGVPGTGAPIRLDYSGTAGAVTGATQPTGQVVDVVATDAFGDVNVSIVDVANVVVYVLAADVGLTGIEGPGDYPPQTLAGLEEIRARVAVRLGFCEQWQDAEREASMFPLISVIAPPMDYQDFATGATVVADDVDLLGRMQVLRRLHPAYAGTGLANLGMAALIPGSVVHGALRPAARAGGTLRLGHPSGVATVDASVQGAGTNWSAKRLVYERTARRLMEGVAYVRTRGASHD